MSTGDPDAPTGQAPAPGTLAARRAAAAEGGAARRRTPPRPRADVAPDEAAAPATPGSSAPTPVRVGAALEGERDETTEFLLQSLRDLEREHDAGDLDDDDYEALKADYTVRAAAALRAEERGKAPPAPVKQRRPARQWALIAAGITAFAVLAGVFVAQASGERQAGEGATGEVIDSPTQAAGRCIQLSGQLRSGEGDPAEAVACYDAVLEDDPDNPVALTYLGWTLYLTAQQLADVLPEDELADLYVGAHRQLDRAVEADPRYADARAFQVVLAVNEGRFEDAAEHLAAFDELDAPADMGVLVDTQRQEIADGLAAAEASEGGDGPGAGSSTTAPAPTSVPG